MSEGYNNQGVNEEACFEHWVTADSAPNKQFSMLGSIRRDIRDASLRYEYFEAFCRNIPGYFGKRLRYLLLNRYSKRVGDNVVIWPGSRVRYPQNIALGDNVSMSFDCVLQAAGGISIGDNTLVGPGVKIWSSNHLFKNSDRTINTQGYEGYPVTIGKDCWIGAGSFIRPGTVLPDGCVLLPLTVLGRLKILPYSVVSGNPARVLGPRARVGATMGWGAVLRSSVG